MYCVPIRSQGTSLVARSTFSGITKSAIFSRFPTTSPFFLSPVGFFLSFDACEISASIRNVR